MVEHPHYNKNSCMRKATHETKGVLYRHICSSCWSKDGNQFAHAQSDCRKSQGQSNKRVKMGTPIYRHDHPSQTFVNSNFTRNPDHGLFSSPYNLKSAFQRVMAFFIDLIPKCCLLNVIAPFIKV